MLHQVVRAGAMGGSVRGEGTHGVPLVEAREYYRPLPSWSLCLPRSLDMDVFGQQVEPRVALPHLLPQVRRAIPRRVWGVPCTAGFTWATRALVEGQEPRGGAFETGREVHLVWI